ncbi:TonB-dependent receptor domain-containing protein [Pontibacter sp. G13]|uniref:TonB-dependent receptor n=1 Tax=Pontibacter sp. G13 TaxID=3074898 RepID=UPI00288A41E4|nr:TonB-dependent receptor [Pontibacter sp. G13]WNJ20158.1 carboxypeptidase regulatory-like domain-containing protein [Pontibacter sp. G13]
MLRRFSTLSLFLLMICHWAVAQDGKLAGKVLDKDGLPVSFATVVVFDGELVKHGGQTDAEGTFSFNPVAAGTYRVQARYLGNVKAVDGVSVVSGQTRRIEIKFSGDAAAAMDTVEIVAEDPIQNDPVVGSQMSGDEIRQSAIRNVNAIAGMTAGVNAGVDGGLPSIRGARASATTYYIDGVRVRGLSNLPQASIQSVQVFTGGTPAEFGDFTGGVIALTSRNPASSFSGTVEGYSSRLTDAYNHNQASVTLTGPLAFKKTTLEDGQTFKSSVLGFFINGELFYNEDGGPSAAGIYKLNDSVLADLQAVPVEISEDGNTFRSRANFVGADDIEEIKAKQNNSQLRFRALARIDFQPTDNIILKVGGNYERIDIDQWGTTNMLFSPDVRSKFYGNQYRGWARFQQSFNTKSKNALVRNLFYSLQADYSLYERRFMNSQHRENFFDYGYVGKFEFDQVPVYGYFNNPTGDDLSSSPYWRTLGYLDQNLTFDDSDTRNPELAAYNNVIFDYAEQNGLPSFSFLAQDPITYGISNLQELAFRQGILNGGGPRAVYSLQSGVGATAGSYTKFDFERYGFSGQATAEIGPHNLKLGFEFEQRVERYYAISARSLWGLMRQLTNFHLNNLEDDPALYSYMMNAGGEWNDTISVPFAYNAQDQTAFDIKLREKLGLEIDGTQRINIDALAPEDFSLDMFTADELLQGGLGYINYYGYDYLGNKATPVADERFFTDPINRPQNAYAPTYVSAFIQDKFEFEDIIFNIGLRVDRFDANQKVLKDPYSLVDTYTASDLSALWDDYELPEGVGGTYVPYVSNVDPTEADIIGYRDGEVWYDRNGAPISSNEIANGSPNGRPLPYIREADTVSINSFKDYEPQTVFMPRISFSFPITDQASFFAHYDVLAQRPGQASPTTSSLLAGQISQYAFLENRPTVAVTNPNLQPEITIDYEAGFKQRVGERMAITISAFYRDMKNMIRYRRYNNAYPYTYDTYDNLDFGTVKGFNFIADMRRWNNLRFSANYTLQFSDATGSSFNSARAVVNSLDGVGVLRSAFPTGSDQRHAINVNMDYRFVGSAMGPGFDIGGKTIYPLKNAGANMVLYMGSGTPYSASAAPAPSILSGVNITNQLQGTPNGARKPWQFRVDLRLDKSFDFGGKVKNEKRGRVYSFNVFAEMLNVLDIQNITNVYRFTGLPDDDGYLTSASGELFTLRQIDPEAFVDQYTTLLINPGNYSLPRRIRLGVLFNF